MLLECHLRRIAHQRADRPDDGVLENADLHDPQKPQPGRHPLDKPKREHPAFDLQILKHRILLSLCVTQILQEEIEETGNNDRLIAIANDLVGECLAVEEVGERADDGVDGWHEEHADYVSLLQRTGVVCQVLPDEPERGDGRDYREDSTEEPADIVG